jgi:hypothetical protein
MSRAHRRLTFGRLLYLCWYAPRSFCRKCLREGPLNLCLAWLGRRAMVRAACWLPAFSLAPPDAPKVFFLTGAQFWYQTAFCAFSLLVHAARPIRIVAVDDGTLTREQAEKLGRIFPGLQILWADESERRLEAHLPAARFPTLRRRRLVYPHLRKLMDVHAGNAGWRLVLDSDMLFHRRPDLLLDWLENPHEPLHMVDVEDAYGYSSGLMTELAGASIPQRLNVGLCGLRSDMIEWDRLEAWCRAMLEREGSHYLQEQAMVAMLTAGQPRAIAPPTEYIVKPSRAEVEHPTAALHHYVAETKAWYFRFGWQRLQCIAKRT